MRPTVKEVEEHNLTHLPFRNWCIFCVKGKAKDDPHKRKIKEDENQDIPIVSIDYMFMESRGSRLRRGFIWYIIYHLNNIFNVIEGLMKIIFLLKQIKQTACHFYAQGHAI